MTLVISNRKVNIYFCFIILKLTKMDISNVIFVNWTNGAIIMTIVFALVIAALVGAVYYMAKSDKGLK